MATTYAYAIRRNNETYAVKTDVQLRSLAVRRQIVPMDYVFIVKQNEWVRAGTIPSLKAIFSAQNSKFTTKLPEISKFLSNPNLGESKESEEERNQKLAKDLNNIFNDLDLDNIPPAVSILDEIVIEDMADSDIQEPPKPPTASVNLEPMTATSWEQMEEPASVTAIRDSSPKWFKYGLVIILLFAMATAMGYYLGKQDNSGPAMLSMQINADGDSDEILPVRKVDSREPLH